ncbi:MAG: hypothetical protein JSU96_14525 [Acidobacteriota bacterium]|nr:MAG: hypothetical protein JSU96_14525 [Acidobacteriota bacterium]
MLPPLYIAYRRDLSQISGVYHSNLRQRWEEGDPTVVEAMKEFAAITEAGRTCLLSGDKRGFSELMDRNFNLRAQLVKLDPANVEMIELARSFGVSAKYAGSGGAIVGVCEDDQTFEQMREAFELKGCEVFRPRI